MIKRNKKLLVKTNLTPKKFYRVRLLVCLLCIIVYLKSSIKWKSRADFLFASTEITTRTEIHL